ncbi:unnamed protein product, partial [Candidula unifasciata]
NSTLEANETLTEGSDTQVTPLPTEGYTRKRIRPRPHKPSHKSTDSTTESSLRVLKMESRANPCGIPMMFLWPLCLCPWIF